MKTKTHTAKGDKRGYIESSSLKELWFHTGTTCNLSCSFCLEGSYPGNNRLEEPTLDELQPLINEALKLGVEQFSFTGGEPFVNPNFMAILGEALKHKPCLVLTNATTPLKKHFDEILALPYAKERLSLRVSIDSWAEDDHDSERGKGNYKRALQNVNLLQKMGLNISIARQSLKQENAEEVDKNYRSVFEKFNINPDTRIVSFPDFLPPDSKADVPEITEDCMTRYHSEETRSAFMCKFSRMVVKVKGQLNIFACTLVDDDMSYATKGNLKESLKTRTMLDHHRCFACFSGGASCSER